MSTADDMRGMMMIARDKERHLRKLKYMEEQEAYERLKQEIAEHSDDLFSKVVEDIKTAAAGGQTHYNYRYNNRDDESKAKTSAIAGAARKQGFTVSYQDESVDHGDSAAPCVVQEYWLEIRWATENYHRQW